ncbi:MAG: ABC transporter permease [Actinobacteria bacterium]|nr:ABC transporter permease [Actinomycetota bacterium]
MPDRDGSHALAHGVPGAPGPAAGLRRSGRSPGPRRSARHQGTVGQRRRGPVGAAWSRLPAMARRIVLAVALIALWALYIRLRHVSPLVFASPEATLAAFGRGWASGEIASATAATLEVLLLGIGIGLVLAAAFTVWATATTVGNDLLTLLTAAINPLPSIAVLPLAMIWFGVSAKAVVFVVAESVLWPLAINMVSGFTSVNPILVMVGRSLGLRRWQYIRRVLLPGALPSIISGVNIAWAMAWRTAIAAELVFGTAGGNGGLGYFINTSQYFLKIPDVLAGLTTIGIVGCAVQAGLGRFEARTVVRWGMKPAA